MSSLVLPFLWLLFAGPAAAADALAFSIWKSDTLRSSSGLLMVSIGGAARGNVCRKERSGSYSGYPSDASASNICKELGFHELGNVDFTSSYASITAFRASYSPKMYKLACSAPNTCTYVATSSCYSSGTNYYTYLNCTCTGNFFATADGCVPCPSGSTAIPGVLKDRCACAAGYFWSYAYRHCVACSPYSFSADNAVNCTKCPDGSRSDAGSGTCSCFPGLYKNNSVCVDCPFKDHYSSAGSTACKRCPEDALASPDHASCVCPDGTFWNPTSNACSTDTPATDTPASTGSTAEPAHQAAGKSTSQYAQVNTALLVVLILGILLLSARAFLRSRSTDTPATGLTVAMSSLPSAPAPAPPRCQEKRDSQIYMDMENETN